MSEQPISTERVEQIRRAHASARPNTDNPAWMNAEVDIGFLLSYIDDRVAMINRLMSDNAEYAKRHLTLTAKCDRLSKMLEATGIERNGIAAERDAALAKLAQTTPPASAEILEKLEGACIAACNCLTKTPDPQHHAAFCRYRILNEAIEHISEMVVTIAHQAQMYASDSARLLQQRIYIGKLQDEHASYRTGAEAEIAQLRALVAALRSEQQAGVVPTRTHDENGVEIPVGDVRRYGAVGDVVAVDHEGKPVHALDASSPLSNGTRLCIKCGCTLPRETLCPDENCSIGVRMTNDGADNEHHQ